MKKKEIIDVINKEWRRCNKSHTLICGCGEYLQGLEFCLKLLMGNDFNYFDYGRTIVDGKFDDRIPIRKSRIRRLIARWNE